MKFFKILFLLILIFIFSPSILKAVPYLYYSTTDVSISPDKIQRIDLSSPSPTPADIITVSGDNTFYGVTVDRTNSYLYWIHYTSGASAIWRSTLSGSSPTQLLNLGSAQARNLALNTNTGRIYWSDSTNAVIKQGDLVGDSITNVSTVSGTTTSALIPLDIDLLNSPNKLYWGKTDQTAGPNIFRANLDGSSKETLDEKAYTVYAIDVVPEGQLMAWVQPNSYLNPEEKDKAFITKYSYLPISTSSEDQYEGGGDTSYKEYPLSTRSDSVPVDIAVDYYAGVAYILEQGFPRGIYKVNFDKDTLAASGYGLYVSTSYYPMSGDLLLDNTRATVNNNTNIYLGSGVVINFASITGDGMTTKAADPGSEGFFLSDPLVAAILSSSIYDVDTTATFDGTSGFNVTLPYSQSDFDIQLAPLGWTEDQLDLFHYTGSGVELGVIISRDTAANIITARFYSSSLSPFGVGTPTPEPTTLLLLGSALLGLLPFRKYLKK